LHFLGNHSFDSGKKHGIFAVVQNSFAIILIESRGLKGMENFKSNPNRHTMNAPKKRQAFSFPSQNPFREELLVVMSFGTWLWIWELEMF